MKWVQRLVASLAGMATVPHLPYRHGKLLSFTQWGAWTPNTAASNLPNTKTFGMVTLLKVPMNKEYNNSCWKARTIDDSAKSQVNEEKTSCRTETCEHKFDHTGIKRWGCRPIGMHSFTRRNVCVRWMCVRAGMFSVCLVCFRYLYGFIVKQRDKRTDKHLSSAVQHATPRLPASTPSYSHNSNASLRFRNTCHNLSFQRLQSTQSHRSQIDTYLSRNGHSVSKEVQV